LAYDFIEFLAVSGIKYWQVCPLNPTSLGDSPYKNPSDLAGNQYFIDLQSLVGEELLFPPDLCRPFSFPSIQPCTLY
jgi:4-alpha-glucanotransferase